MPLFQRFPAINSAILVCLEKQNKKKDIKTNNMIQYKVIRRRPPDRGFEPHLAEDK